MNQIDYRGYLALIAFELLMIQLTALRILFLMD